MIKLILRIEMRKNVISGFRVKIFLLINWSFRLLSIIFILFIKRIPSLCVILKSLPVIEVKSCQSQNN